MSAEDESGDSNRDGPPPYTDADIPDFDDEFIEFSDARQLDALLASSFDDQELVYPDIERERAILALQDQANTLSLRRGIGIAAIGFMGFQLLVADAVFLIYGFYNSWDIPAVVIDGWLAAVVIQVVGVVLVVARSLFPNGGPKP